MLHTVFKFIHDLKVLFLLLIFLLFFNIIGVSPLKMGKFFSAEFGQAVGMSVSIPENPFNKLAIQLKEKESRLNERELALNAREREVSGTDKTQNRIIYGIGAGMMMLLVLIIVNFFMDYNRRKNGRI